MASGQYSRKTIVGFTVIGIHVAFALAIIIGTAVKYVQQNADALEMKLLHKEEELDKHAPPPPPPPDYVPPRVDTPMLEMPTVTGPPPVTAIVKPPAPPPAPAKAAEPPPIIQAKVAKGSNLGEACGSYYPSASRRLSEEGSVVLLVFIAPNGKVTDSKVETSSGFQRLDEAAEKCVKAQGRFEPQKVGNEAVGSWQRMKWTWRLTN